MSLERERELRIAQNKRRLQELGLENNFLAKAGPAAKKKKQQNGENKQQSSNPPRRCMA